MATATPPSCGDKSLTWSCGRAGVTQTGRTASVPSKRLGLVGNAGFQRTQSQGSSRLLPLKIPWCFLRHSSVSAQLSLGDAIPSYVCPAGSALDAAILKTAPEGREAALQPHGHDPAGYLEHIPCPAGLMGWLLCPQRLAGAPQPLRVLSRPFCQMFLVLGCPSSAAEAQSKGWAGSELPEQRL